MALKFRYVVPWRDRNEFAKVYSDLYSEDPVRQQLGFDMVTVWKGRADNKLAVAIESTAGLTMSLLSYHQAEQAKELISKHYVLRCALTLSVIRFVNHVTEKGQNKRFAQPVKQIAKDFGIPDWIVNLRHEGTHGSMPSFDLLVRAAQWSLKYLKKVFWDHQIKESDFVPKTKKMKLSKRALYNESEIHQLLREYELASHKSLEDGPESETAREKNRKLKRLGHALNGIERHIALRCMLQSEHLLTPETQLMTYGVNLEETIKMEPPRVPAVVINIWRDLLKTVQEKKLTTLLLQHLVYALVTESNTVSPSHRCFMLAAWLRLILLYHDSNFPKTITERESQPKLYDGPTEFAKCYVLGTIKQVPTAMGSLLLPLSGDNYCAEKEKEEIQSGSEGDNSAEKDKELQPAEQPKDRNKETAVDRSKLWKLFIEPVDWERLPLGLGPSDSYYYGTAPKSDSTSEEDGSDGEQVGKEQPDAEPPDGEQSDAEQPDAELPDGEQPDADMHSEEDIDNITDEKLLEDVWLP